MRSRHKVSTTVPKTTASSLLSLQAAISADQTSDSPLLSEHVGNPPPVSSPDVSTTNTTSTSKSIDEPGASKQGGFFNGLRKYFHWNIVRTLFGSILSELIEDQDILNLTTRGLSGVLWFAILLGALGTAGFDTKPILSIFGVAGITLGLSLQNLFSDLYAGLFVLFTRPFKRGSVISVCGHTGRVVSMDMRYVHLHNDKEHTDVLLPISIVYRAAVTLVEHCDDTGDPK